MMLPPRYWIRQHPRTVLYGLAVLVSAHLAGVLQSWHG